MGRPGQKSYPLSIRLPAGIIEQIDREVELYRDESTRAEFVQDAVKFYLRYKSDQREVSRKQQSELKEIPDAEPLEKSDTGRV